jgi:hypothetical protein
LIEQGMHERTDKAGSVEDMRTRHGPR